MWHLSSFVLFCSSIEPNFKLNICIFLSFLQFLLFGYDFTIKYVWFDQENLVHISPSGRFHLIDVSLSDCQSNEEREREMS